MLLRDITLSVFACLSAVVEGCGKVPRNHENTKDSLVKCVQDRCKCRATQLKKLQPLLRCCHPSNFSIHRNFTWNTLGMKDFHGNLVKNIPRIWWKTFRKISLNWTYRISLFSLLAFQRKSSLNWERSRIENEINLITASSSQIFLNFYCHKTTESWIKLCLCWTLSYCSRITNIIYGKRFPGTRSWIDRVFTLFDRELRKLFSLLFVSVIPLNYWLNKT